MVTHSGLKVKLFPFDFRFFLSRTRMLFAVSVIGISRFQAQPKTLLAAAHNEAGIDGRRLPFVVQAVVKISGDVLASATKVYMKILWASFVLVQASCFRLKAVINSSSWEVVVLCKYSSGENRLQIGWMVVTLALISPTSSKALIPL